MHASIHHIVITASKLDRSTAFCGQILPLMGSPGLHHLAFHAPDRAAVDRFHEQALHLGVCVLDSPAEYPKYAPGYYAVFFADPDGIKLEYVFAPA